MKTLLSCLALTALLATRAPADDLADQTPAQLKENIEKKHPADYYLLASRLFKDPATKQEALFWFYVGQIRYRYYLAANPDLPPDGDPAVFASLSETIGRPINEYAGGKPDIWLAEMNHALEWDAAHSNDFTPKSKSPERYAQIRAGLVALRDHIAKIKDKMPEIRRQNGLKDP